MVELHVANVTVEGSNPFARSILRSLPELWMASQLSGKLPKALVLDVVPSFAEASEGDLERADRRSARSRSEA